MPAAPTMAAITASASGIDATAEAPSGPQTISTRRLTRLRSAATSSGLRTETSSGVYRSICWARRSRFPPAARPTTRRASGKASTTSSVERPTEPVEPRMETVRIQFGNRKAENQKPETRNQKWIVVWFLVSGFWFLVFMPSTFSRRHNLEGLELVQDEEPIHVQDRRRVENGVEPVEEASVTGDQRPGVFHVRGALPHRFRQIADCPGERENHAGDDGVDQRKVPEEREMDDHRGGHRADNAADQTFHRLLRADARRELVPAEVAADVV